MRTEVLTQLCLLIADGRTGIAGSSAATSPSSDHRGHQHSLFKCVKAFTFKIFYNVAILLLKKICFSLHYNALLPKMTRVQDMIFIT